MLADIKNKKSLTFYQATPDWTISRMAGNSINPAVTANVVAQVGKNVYLFDQEYGSFLKDLNLERADLTSKVAKGLGQDTSYQSARGDGVSLAWKYEKADVQMGGKGSADWNKAEQREILGKGRVRGAEGHHQKNVSAHLEEQANPDNIKFYKTREDHLQKGHQGKWDNETDAPFIDKNKMLHDTNRRRVVKQGLYGLGKATAIGLGMGFSLSFVAEIARLGLSTEEMEEALIKSCIGGIGSATIAATGYGMGLLTSNLLQNIGMDLSSNAGQLLNGTVAGLLSIMMISVYQLANLQMEGELDMETFGQIRNGTACSISVLAVSMIAQSCIGGAAGILVSTATGLVMYTAAIAKTVKEKRLEKCLREYAIEQYRV